MAHYYLFFRKLVLSQVRIVVVVSMVSVYSSVSAQVTELPPIKESNPKEVRARDKTLTAIEINQQPTQSKSGSKLQHGSEGEEMPGISSADRALIEKACNLRKYSGPAAYRACQREQVAAARNSVPVSFDGVSQSDRALIEKACNLRKHSGPATYRACQRHQVSQLK